MAYKDKDKQREYQLEWVKNRRHKFLGGRSCEHCGSDYRLNIHHVNPEDKTSHCIWSWSEVRIEAELEKCIILCEKCHQQLHNPRTVPHGTITMYKNHKCRCEECRAINASYERKRRAGAKTPLEEANEVGKSPAYTGA